jgi:hypothetical protein
MDKPATRKKTPPPPTPNSPAVYYGSLILAIALFLLFALPYARALQVPWLAAYSSGLKYAAFPLAAFALSAATSATCQKIACGTVSAGNVFNGGLYFLFVLIPAILLGEVSYLRAPIVSLFVSDERFSGILGYERETPFVRGIAQGYWVFFGALVGQILAGSTAVVC